MHIYEKISCVEITFALNQNLSSTSESYEVSRAPRCPCIVTG